MKNNLILAAVLILISSCAMHQVNDDMINNKFISLTPVNNSIHGYYTYTMGPLLSTYAIYSDGNGVGCYVQNGNTTINRIKIYKASSNIYNVIEENGLKKEIDFTNKNNPKIIFYGEAYRFNPDQELEISNLSCKEKLKSLKKPNK